METWQIQLIWAAFIVGAIIIGGKVIFSGKVAKAQKNKVQPEKPKKMSLFDRARSALDDPDSMIAELDKHIEDQRKRGVTDDQMKLMLDEKNMIEKYAKNQYVQMVAPPIIDYAQNFLKGFGIKL